MLRVQWYDTANVDENSFDRWLKGDIKGEVSSGSLAILGAYAPNPGTTSEVDGPQMGDLTHKRAKSLERSTSLSVQVFRVFFFLSLRYLLQAVVTKA